MQVLRNARILARLVLAWFALAIGLAVAGPIVKPQSMELICSGGGPMKLLVKQSGGDTQEAGASLDCPLCLPFDVPTPHPQLRFASQPTAGGQLHPPGSSPIAVQGAVPPPARAPPAAS